MSPTKNPILKGLLGLAALRACRGEHNNAMSVLDAAFCEINKLMTETTGYNAIADTLEALGIGSNVLFDRPLHAAASHVPLRGQQGWDQRLVIKDFNTFNHHVG